MAEPWEWTEGDLLGLVASGRQEDLQLEYKASAAIAEDEKAKTEISKDVSAFANSAGGTILYGIRENEDHRPYVDHGIDPGAFSKEWLENIIAGRIHRRIQGVRIGVIPIESSAPGRVVYAVCIPESSDAPHQAHDKRFYKRWNFQSVPMEEHEIRDLALRGNQPLLSLGVYPDRSSPASTTATGANFWLRVLLNNSGNAPAAFAAIQFMIDNRAEVIGTSGIFTSHAHETAGEKNQWVGFHTLAARWRPIDGFPCFRGAPADVTGRSPIALDTSEIAERGGTGTFAFGWKISAPGAQPREGYGVIEFLGKNELRFSPGANELTLSQLLAYPGLEPAGSAGEAFFRDRIQVRYRKARDRGGVGV